MPRSLLHGCYMVRAPVDHLGLDPRQSLCDVWGLASDPGGVSERVGSLGDWSRGNYRSEARIEKERMKHIDSLGIFWLPGTSDLKTRSLQEGSPSTLKTAGACN